MPSRAEELLKARLGDDVEVEKPVTFRRDWQARQPKPKEDPFDAPQREANVEEVHHINELLRQRLAPHAIVPIQPSIERN